VEYNGNNVMDSSELDLSEIEYYKEEDTYKDWTIFQLLDMHLSDLQHEAFTIGNWGDVEEECVYFELDGDIWQWKIEEDSVCEVTNEHRIMYYSNSFIKMQ